MTVQITALRPGSDDDEELLRSWTRHLRAANRADTTIAQYTRSARYLMRHLDRPLVTASRADVEDYLVATIDATSANTAAVRYRCLKQLYRWLAAEGEIAVNPFAGVRQPKTDDTLPRVLTIPELVAVIGACAAPAGVERGDVRVFEAVRDEAMLRLFADTGVRASGMVQQTLASIDVDRQMLTVVEKRKERSVPFGAKTAAALDRYLRLRRRRPSAVGTDALWLSRRGPMTYSGVRLAVRRRGAAAGIAGLRPHLLRHSAAHHMKLAGVQNDDLKVLFGWTSDAMVSLYGRSAAKERAMLAARKHGVGDRL